MIAVAVFLLVIGSCKISKSELMPEIRTADSTTVMYYDTPGNPRYFKFMKVADMKSMMPVIKDANRKIITEGMEDCVTRGKIYFYGSKGAVYVVYFSDTEECMTLSFIITGEKYYTRMSSVTKNLLGEWQKQAKEPGRGN